MKQHTKKILTSFCLLITITRAYSMQKPADQKMLPQAILNQLAAMHTADLETRHKARIAINQGLLEIRQAQAQQHIFHEKPHAQKLKIIIDQYGPPCMERWGLHACINAFHIAYYANHDLALQEKCVHALANDHLYYKEMRLYFAHLLDRFLLNQGLAQRYGTQRDIHGNPFPLEEDDPDILRQMREYMGLPT